MEGLVMETPERGEIVETVKPSAVVYEARCAECEWEGFAKMSSQAFASGVAQAHADQCQHTVNVLKVQG